jgi:hypothetical protein
VENLRLSSSAAKLLDDIAGPVTKDIGEMIKDELQPYRAIRELKLMGKTVKMVQEAGFQPKAVPPKLLLTAVENGGMEGDEDLHTKWAALRVRAGNMIYSLRSQRCCASFRRMM